MSSEKCFIDDFKRFNDNFRPKSSLQSDDLRNKLNSNKNNQLQQTADSSIITEDCCDVNLFKEYVQWDFICNKLYQKGKELMIIYSPRSEQEFVNTLQRWLIWINEQHNDVPKFFYFSLLPEVLVTHPAGRFLSAAILEKGFVNDPISANKVVDHLFTFISNNHQAIFNSHGHQRESTGECQNEKNPPLPLIRIEFDPINHILKAGTFESRSLARIKLLVDKGGLIATARMLLRYESFGNGSYQWGDPQEVHKVLYDKFHVRYEGFASPLNSRFIEFSKTWFCSLFLDTDQPFGSLGDFFQVDMKLHEGGWSVNPPFVNDLMLEVAKRIIKVLDDGCRCWFFCTFPSWDDDKGWQMLNSSRYLSRKFNLRPQHFEVQDAYGEKFFPNMQMNLFVLGELPSYVARPIELGNTLIFDNRKSLPSQCPW